jgi:hypothetical protein
MALGRWPSEVRLRSCVGASGSGETGSETAVGPSASRAAPQASSSSGGAAAITSSHAGVGRSPRAGSWICSVCDSKSLAALSGATPRTGGLVSGSVRPSGMATRRDLGSARRGSGALLGSGRRRGPCGARRSSAVSPGSPARGKRASSGRVDAGLVGRSRTAEHRAHSGVPGAFSSPHWWHRIPPTMLLAARRESQLASGGCRAVPRRVDRARGVVRSRLRRAHGHHPAPRRPAARPKRRRRAGHDPRPAAEARSNRA